MGLALGFDAINSERSEGTLNRSCGPACLPDAVINGKFLAGAAIIFLMVFSMGLIAGRQDCWRQGFPPSGEELGRVIVLLFFTSVYICFGLHCPSSFRSVPPCGHVGYGSDRTVDILCTVYDAGGSMATNVLYPVGQTATASRILDNYNCQMSLNRLSPYYLYSEAVSTIMNPQVRSTNIILPRQLSGAINGYLSWGRVSLLVWPHLTGLRP